MLTAVLNYPWLPSQRGQNFIILMPSGSKYHDGIECQVVINTRALMPRLLAQEAINMVVFGARLRRVHAGLRARHARRHASSSVSRASISSSTPSPADLLSSSLPASRSPPLHCPVCTALIVVALRSDPPASSLSLPPRASAPAPCSSRRGHGFLSALVCSRAPDSSHRRK